MIGKVIEKDQSEMPNEGEISRLKCGLSVPMSRPESGRPTRSSPWLSKMEVLNKADAISIFIRITL